MPLYEYRCKRCERIETLYRPIARRNRMPKCRCGGKTERLIPVPHAASWNPEERFPNLSNAPGDGSMTFESRDAYERYLKDNDLYETGTPRCGRGKTSLRHIKRFGKKPSDPTPRGAW